MILNIFQAGKKEKFNFLIFFHRLPGRLGKNRDFCIGKNLKIKKNQKKI